MGTQELCVCVCVFQIYLYSLGLGKGCHIGHVWDDVKIWTLCMEVCHAGAWKNHYCLTFTHDVNVSIFNVSMVQANVFSFMCFPYLEAAHPHNMFGIKMHRGQLFPFQTSALHGEI